MPKPPSRKLRKSILLPESMVKEVDEIVSMTQYWSYTRQSFIEQAIREKIDWARDRINQRYNLKE